MIRAMKKKKNRYTIETNAGRKIPGFRWDSLRSWYLSWDLQYDEKPVCGKKEREGKKEKEREGNKWEQVGGKGSHTLQAVINSMSKGLRWKNQDLGMLKELK